MKRIAIVYATALALGAGGAFAQGFPAKPVRLVVPFPPGGSADVIARMLTPRLQEATGQPFLVDNRPGATGNVGAEAVARATPDGYTLLQSVSAITVNPWLAKPPFDVARDLAPVTQLISGSYVLVANPKVQAASLGELIALAKAQPGKLNYGSYGNGSGPHLAMEMLKGAASVAITHVPYKGFAPMQQALLAGEIDVAFDTSVGAVPQVKAGKLKALAVGGLKPVAALPGVPTIAATYPGFDTDGWQGVFVPAGTPREAVATLQSALAKALHAPEVAQRLRELGFEPVGSTPDEFGAFVRNELAKWGKVIRDNGIKPD